jgi:hypothetical protein
MNETFGLIAAAAACFLAGMHVGQWLEARRGRSARQVVGRSSAGQPVAAAVIAAGAAVLEPRGAGEEEAEWLKVQKNRIVTKLTKDFPTLGTSKREAVAEEIMAKARSTLARVR